MIERKYLESGFRIFVIKSIQEPQHNFDGFIDLQKDNVVNTFLYIQLKKNKEIGLDTQEKNSQDVFIPKLKKIKKIEKSKNIVDIYRIY